MFILDYFMDFLLVLYLKDNLLVADFVGGDKNRGEARGRIRFPELIRDSQFRYHAGIERNA